jgi:hypothetical protein
MALLAQRLSNVGRRFAPSRPYWSLALRAFSNVLANQRPTALQELNEWLGIGRQIDARERQARTEQSVEDIVCAAAVQIVLSGGQDELVNEIRARSLGRGDGTSLAFLDAIIAWSAAVNMASPANVLPAADPVFADDRLARYVSGIQVPALFPAQIEAVRSGATFDSNRMVALPTSSGKTLVAELRIVATLTRRPGTRAIYVAPYRLLSRQVEHQLRRGVHSGTLGRLTQARGLRYRRQYQGRSIPRQLFRLGVRRAASCR